MSKFVASNKTQSFQETKPHHLKIKADTDVVVVGSSIIHLVKALALASNGLKVMVLEQRSSLGGVWSTIDTLGLDKIERAPHIFMPTAMAYDFIENVLETELSVMDPQPIAIEVDEYCKIISQSEFPVSPETCHPEVLYDGVCKHPKNGTNALVETLLRLGRDMGVQFRPNIHVHTLRIDDEQQITVVSQSRQFTAKKVVLSRGSPVLQIHDGHSRVLPYHSSTNISLHLLLKTNKLGTFSFVHVDNHPLIKEIHDITTHSDGVNAGHRLIVMKLRYNIFEQSQLPMLDAHAIFANLQKIGLFDVSDVVEKSSTTGYMQTRLLESSLEDLQRNFGAAVEIVPFPHLNCADARPDLCAQDISVALSAPEFYERLLS